MSDLCCTNWHWDSFLSQGGSPEATILKIVNEVAGSSEKLIPICQTTRVQIQEIHNPVRYTMLQL